MTFVCSAAGLFGWTSFWFIMFLISCVVAFFASVGKSIERDEIDKINGMIKWNYYHDDLIEDGISEFQIACYEANTGRTIPPGSNPKAKTIEVNIVVRSHVEAEDGTNEES
jgi:hypothetical protein